MLVLEEKLFARLWMFVLNEFSQGATMRYVLILVAALVVGFGGSVGESWAETGVTETTVRFGSTMGLTGPIAFLGSNSRIGLETYVRQVNDAGGIHGRTIELTIEDDQYQAVKAIAGYQKLTQRDRVFALCNTLGTVTTDALLQFVEEDKIPLVAPSALSRSITEPLKRQVFAIVPDYHDQMIVLANYAIKNLKKRKVAYLYQNDAAGQSGLGGIQAALRQNALEPAALIAFETATKDFSAIVLKARQANPDIVLLITVPVNAALIIKEAAKFGWDVPIGGHMALVDDQLLRLAGATAEGVMAAGAVALVEDDSPAVREYRENLKKYFPDAQPNTWSLLSYAAGKVCVEGLRRAGRELTREKYVKALEELKGFETGVVGPITYGATRRAGNQAIAIMKVKDGRFGRVTGWIGAER